MVRGMDSRAAHVRATISRVAGEFIVIVAGVLVALAADDWRQGRERATVATASLNAMLSDLAADSVLLQGVIDSYRLDDASGTSLLAAIDDPAFPLDSAEALLEPFYLGAPYAPSRAAFATALESGTLEFIADDDLRLSIVSYFDQSSTVFGGNFEDLLEELFELHELMRPHLRPRITPELSSMWPMPASPRRLVSSWEEFRSDNALLIQLLEFTIYAGYMVDFASGRLEANLALQRDIRSTLAPA